MDANKTRDSFKDVRSYVEWLRQKAEDARRECDSITAQIKAEENRCSHSWSDPAYNPIITKGYHVPGSAHRYANGYIPYDEIPYKDGYDVPEKVEKRWTRTCKLCGKVEYTTSSKQEVKTKDIPIF